MTAERDTFVAEVGDDVQPATERLDVGGQGSPGPPVTLSTTGPVTAWSRDRGAGPIVPSDPE